MGVQISRYLFEGPTVLLKKLPSYSIDAYKERKSVLSKHKSNDF